MIEWSKVKCSSEVGHLFYRAQVLEILPPMPKFYSSPTNIRVHLPHKLEGLCVLMTRIQYMHVKFPCDVPVKSVGTTLKNPLCHSSLSIGLGRRL